LLNQDFKVDTPDTVWVGDITYNWTDEGLFYTAIVKDLCTKDVVGYAMSNRITKELVIAAFKMALKRIKPSSGLTFHSDYAEKNTIPKFLLNYFKYYFYFSFFGIANS
jgi:putative transposase